VNPEKEKRKGCGREDLQKSKDLSLDVPLQFTGNASDQETQRFSALAYDARNY